MRKYQHPLSLVHLPWHQRKAYSYRCKYREFVRGTMQTGEEVRAFVFVPAPETLCMCPSICMHGPAGDTRSQDTRPAGAARAGESGVVSTCSLATTPPLSHPFASTLPFASAHSLSTHSRACLRVGRCVGALPPLAPLHIPSHRYTSHRT
eukprot:1906802-Pleurochrysis_carterae.AAC.6